MDRSWSETSAATERAGEEGAAVSVENQPSGGLAGSGDAATVSSSQHDAQGNNMHRK
jgi:hypothetical protein